MTMNITDITMMLTMMRSNEISTNIFIYFCCFLLTEFPGWNMTLLFAHFKLMGPNFFLFQLDLSFFLCFFVPRIPLFQGSDGGALRRRGPPAGGPRLPVAASRRRPAPRRLFADGRPG